MKNNQGKNNPNYKDGRCSRKKYCKNCGKQIATGRKSIRCNKCSNSGKNNPFYGKKHSLETKKIIGEKSKKKWTKKYIDKIYKKQSGFKKYINGYILVKDYKHPNRSKKKYVLEHIKVMSNYLNRPIKKGEIVHHINFVRDNNKIKNLYLCKNTSEHMKINSSLYRLVKNLIDLKIIKFKKGKYLMNIKGEMPKVVIGGKS